MNTKFTYLAALLALCVATALAEPSVKLSSNTFTIAEGVTDAILEQIKADIGKVDKAKLAFELKKIKNEDLAKLVAAFPEMTSLNISDSKELDSLAPVAALKNLTSIRTSSIAVADLAPLAGLTQLKSLELSGDQFGPDLKWMTGLTNLTNISISAGKKLTSFEGIPSLPALKRIYIHGAAPADLTPLVTALPGLEYLTLNGCTIADLTPLTALAKLEDLSLYGSTLKDFSPLAGCAKLRKLSYYAVKEADFATLGKLTQLETLHGGLTELADISWIENLDTNLRKFNVFSERVKDYSPLAKTKVDHFTIWSMKVPVDLTSLGGATTLTFFKIWSMDKGVTAFEALGKLTALKEVVINGVNKKEGSVDVAFLATLPDLEKLELSDSPIVNFDAVAACTKLTLVDLAKATGITSLAPLKKLPDLKYLTVTKGAFSDEELTGFGEKVKINQR